MISDRTRNVVVLVVTGVWVLNFVAGLAFHSFYQPSESINGIFTAIVGGAIAASAVKRNSSKDE